MKLFHQPEACYFSDIYASVFLTPVWLTLLSSYYTDCFGTLSLSLFTKTCSWICLRLVSFIRESAEKWEMENQVLLANFLDTLGCSVSWRCFLMEQETTRNKAGLIKTMIILKVYHRNNYFHRAEPKPLFGGQQRLNYTHLL